MKSIRNHKWMLILAAAICAVIVTLFAQEAPQTRPEPHTKGSYMPVVETESLAIIRGRMSAAKATVMKRQMNLLAERYDLNNRPAEGVVMDRSKPVQEGV